MTPELLVLVAASLVAVQIVTVILRREHLDDAPYLALLMIDLGLLVWVHLTGRHATLAAFVGEGIAGMLTLTPRLLDGLERAALSRDRFDRAAQVALVRELLMPGRTAARRRQKLGDLAQTRDGGGLAVARRLRSQVAESTDPARAAELREELATVLFFDRRFAEGVEEIERHTGLDEVARRPAFAAYLVRAYGELGRLDRAAQVLAQLEEGPARRDLGAAGLLAQARLTFLAFAGRPAHVEALLVAPPGAFLPARARQFLLDTAHARVGVALEPEVARLAETVFRRSALPEGAPRHGRPPVTLLLLAANLLVFVVLAVVSRRPQAALHELDGALLVRAGALFRPAVRAGEWWRLLTAMFLHASFWHLAVNLYALYLLGRFTEEVFGAARYLAVYLCAGLVGALASTLLGAGALSVGASGAIMGLLGALIVTLVLRRGTWPEAWRRALLWNLVLLGALQIYIGFEVPMIDNAAHVGGMLGGAMATVLFAPGGLFGSGRPGTVAAVMVAAILGGLVVVSAGFTLATSLPRTLARVATRRVEVGGTRLTVPAYWDVDADRSHLEDPYLDLVVKPEVADGAVKLLVNPEVTDGGLLQSGQAADDPRYRALFDRIERSARP